MTNIKVTDNMIIEEVPVSDDTVRQTVIITKEAFIEAYNKWIKGEPKE